MLLHVGDADSTVFTTLKEYPNLSVITSGPIPPNSSEILGSARMKDLMDRLRKEYEVVIMDTPPILPVTDAVVASSLADGVILVVQADKTCHCEVNHAQEVLEAAHANLLGVVLNRARRHSWPHHGPPAVRSRELGLSRRLDRPTRGVTIVYGG